MSKKAAKKNNGSLPQRFKVWVPEDCLRKVATEGYIF